ncbi:hypothetical protein AALM99_07555 [Lactococcus muris]|uniref:Uncharacterized protein n=1 Tax=Lactococcus muris TaxID=2941330 RepID=A0ABV4D957_9LACT
MNKQEETEVSSIIIANEETAKYIATLDADIGKFLVQWVLDNNMGMRHRGQEIKFFLNTKSQYQQLREKITNLNIRNDIIISQNKEEELMNKQTEKHPVAITGITESGEVKKLDVNILRAEEVEKENLNFEEEYLLINKLPEMGVKIDAKLKEGGPNNVEKMMFMLGEATYALALMTKPVLSIKNDSEHFKEFMIGFIASVIKYHSQGGK